ncbi:MAG: metallophosphoesterase [bacterium]|nr:metallophosphoesterase [bacterium]
MAVLVITAVIILAILVYGIFIEPFRIKLNDVRIENRNPCEGKSLKILHISDLHLRRFGRREEKLTQMLSSLQPDLILITGDFMENIENPNQYKKLFESLHSRLGVFGVLGNNDYGINKNTKRVKKIEGFLERMNVEILKNSSAVVEENIRIIGLDDPHKGYDNLSLAFQDIRKDDSLRLVLAHSPETLDFILSRKPDLVLTGHTHGGQISFPFIGPVFLNIKKGFRIMTGLNYFNEIPVYQSSGVGITMFPIRLNCRPEITMITLEN